MLQSKKGDAVVIWDAVLPKADKGKVLLFNTQKDTLVEYVEDIVQPKLRDLTATEMSDASEQYGDRWQSVRAVYAPEEKIEESSKKRTSDAELKDVLEPGVDEDDLGLDDDFEDL